MNIIVCYNAGYRLEVPGFVSVTLRIASPNEAQKYAETDERPLYGLCCEIQKALIATLDRGKPAVRLAFESRFEGCFEVGGMLRVQSRGRSLSVP